MTQFARAAWITSMHNLIKTRGDNGITGALLQELLDELADSIPFFITDSSYLGLREHDTLIAYSSGMTTVKDGFIYKAIVDNQGTFDIADWIIVGQSPAFGYADYDNATSYVVGNKVTYQSRLFRTIVDVQGVAPINNDDSINVNWEEISANLSAVIKAWAAGAYLRDSTVRYNSKFYYLDEDDGFISTDMAAEIIAGSWVEIQSDFDFFILRSNGDAAHRFKFTCDDTGMISMPGEDLGV